MTVEELQQVSFEIILHAGNARSHAMEAIYFSKRNQFKEAWEKVQVADRELIKAHKTQSKLLQDEFNGSRNEMSILLIHAQDHLMTSITVKDLAVEMIEMYERMNQIEGCTS